MDYDQEARLADVRQLMPAGFALVQAVQAFGFVRTFEDRTETIWISYRVRNFRFQGMSAEIRFAAVEDLLDPLLDKYGVEMRYGEVTVQTAFPRLAGVDYPRLDADIDSPDAFQRVAPVLTKLISEGALPFFQSNSSLEKINRAIDAMSEDALSVFVSGMVSIKIPLIKKLVGAADFAVQLQKQSEFFQGEALKYPQYFKDYDKVFFELFAKDLESLPPPQP